jgi:predicted N-acetyltransferase YhbS
MPEGTKCWIIATLIVALKFQRGGVGRALMEWGTSRAEREVVFAWVHGSDGSWQAYRACGFEVVRQLRVLLDEYAEGRLWESARGKNGRGGRIALGIWFISLRERWGV